MVGDPAEVLVQVDTPPGPVAVGALVGSAVLGLVEALVVLEAQAAPVVLAAVPVAARVRAGSAVLHVDQSVVVVATRTSSSRST